MVLAVDSIDQPEALRSTARQLRFPAEADERGANVTFIEKRTSYIKALTYERGVEDFTLACGTGAVAARWKVRDEFSQRQPLKVKMPGGDLMVALKFKGDSCAAELGGNAAYVFEGRIGG